MIKGGIINQIIIGARCFPPSAQNPYAHDSVKQSAFNIYRQQRDARARLCAPPRIISTLAPVDCKNAAQMIALHKEGERRRS